MLILCGTEAQQNSSGIVRGMLTGMVAGVDAETAAHALLDKLRHAAAAAGGATKASLVTVEGGGTGGGLLEAKPQEVIAGVKLFLHKCCL